MVSDLAKRGAASLRKRPALYPTDRSRAVTPYGVEVGSARKAYNEFRGTTGLDATRYGDWEYSGRCTDF